MTSIFDKEVTDALDAMEKERIGSTEFENGLTLRLMSVERNANQYGAAEDSAIVERGILKEGEQFVFTFEDADGTTRKFSTSSFPFVIAVRRAGVEVGDQVFIKRTGKARETKYEITKQ